MPYACDMPYSSETLRMIRASKIMKIIKTMPSRMRENIILLDEQFRDIVEPFGNDRYYEGEALLALKEMALQIRSSDVSEETVRGFVEKFLPPLERSAAKVISDALENGMVEDEMGITQMEQVREILKRDFDAAPSALMEAK